MPFPGAVRKSRADNFQIAEIIQGAAVLEECTSFAAGLIGEDAAGWSNQLRHGQAVQAEIGTDIDRRHSRLKKATQEGDFLLEPFLLLQQDVGGDSGQRG